MSEYDATAKLAEKRSLFQKIEFQVIEIGEPFGKPWLTNSDTFYDGSFNFGDFILLCFIIEGGLKSKVYFLIKGKVQLSGNDDYYLTWGCYILKIECTKITLVHLWVKLRSSNYNIINYCILMRPGQSRACLHHTMRYGRHLNILVCLTTLEDWDELSTQFICLLV